MRKRLAQVAAVIGLALVVWWTLDRVVVPGFFPVARAPAAPGGPIARSSAAASGAQPPAPVAKPPRFTVGAPSAGAKTTPLPPLGTPLTAIYRDLQDRVAHGDAAAACRLAFELDRCAKLPSLREVPAFWRHAATMTADPKQLAQLEGFRTSSVARLAEAERSCAGFPSDQTDYAWDYALAAALAGNRMAIWHTTFFPWGLDVKHPENTLEGWEQWRTYAPSLLESGVQGGDPRIFSLMSRAYRLPSFGVQLFPRDPVRAAAYFMAIAPSAAPAYRAGMQSDLDYLIRTLGLDANDVERARALAQTLPPLKGIPLGGFDWSSGMSPNEDGSECEGT